MIAVGGEICCTKSLAVKQLAHNNVLRTKLCHFLGFLALMLVVCISYNKSHCSKFCSVENIVSVL